MRFLKPLFLAFYRDSKKTSVVWGLSLVFFVSVAVFSKPESMTFIEKLNATSHIWKIMLVVFLISFAMYLFEVSIKKDKKRRRVS